MTELVAPFPYFGGKRRAAPLVWEALGDVGGYVEPFAGSAAVLLARPKVSGRRVETLNDMDGWLVNVWRSIQLDPSAVAAHASGPVTEIDYHARLAWLQERRTPELVSWLEGDPEAHDAKAAGWWLYVAACGIGDPWGSGPWRVVDGHLRDTRKLPHLGDAGRGVRRPLPHLTDAGQGVSRKDNLVPYMQSLADRLRHVRITCGDWRRVLSPIAIGFRATAGNQQIGILLDPPYSVGAGVYATTNTDDTARTISADVREWCLATDPKHRIVLAGYDNEHDALLSYGWTKIAGKAGSSGRNWSDSKGRERLWQSPACLTANTLFDIHTA